MTLEFSSLVGPIITGLFGLNVFFFRWLLGSFKSVKQDIEASNVNTAKVQDTMSRMLDIHEAKDQTRHEENLHRFESISVSLARLGSDNGTYKGKNS